jgi:hypothetical protein
MYGCDVNLTGANLAEADLRGAVLDDVDFTGADANRRTCGPQASTHKPTASLSNSPRRCTGDGRRRHPTYNPSTRPSTRRFGPTSACPSEGWISLINSLVCR